MVQTLGHRLLRECQPQMLDEPTSEGNGEGHGNRYGFEMARCTRHRLPFRPAVETGRLWKPESQNGGRVRPISGRNVNPAAYPGYPRARFLRRQNFAASLGVYREGLGLTRAFAQADNCRGRERATALYALVAGYRTSVASLPGSNPERTASVVLYGTFASVKDPPWSKPREQWEQMLSSWEEHWVPAF